MLACVVELRPREGRVLPKVLWIGSWNKNFFTSSGLLRLTPERPWLARKQASGGFFQADGSDLWWHRPVALPGRVSQLPLSRRLLPDMGQTTHLDWFSISSHLPPTSCTVLWSHRAAECWGPGGWWYLSSANSSLIPSVTFSSILVHALYSLQSASTLLCPLRPKPALGAGQGRDNAPYYRRGKGSSKRQVPCLSLNA